MPLRAGMAFALAAGQSVKEARGNIVLLTEGKRLADDLCLISSI